MLKKIVLFLFCCHISLILHAQVEVGGMVGLSATFGSKIKRLGLKGTIFVYGNFAQINLETAAYYNWNGWGPDVSRWEGQISVGGLGAWGKRDTGKENPFLQSLQNQTQRPYSIGYSYKLYLDNIETSQSTGILYFGVKNWRLIGENDIFGWTGEDKFRTSRVVLEYRYQNTLFAMRNFLWTGDPEFHIRPPVRDSLYPSRFGYYDLSECKYCDYSHGILAFQVKQSLPFNQTAQASFGIDSERVRHFTQNKVIHDMLSISMKWILAENPHVPMLDENNEQYLFKEGQKIRPFKWFWELGVNSE